MVASCRLPLGMPRRSLSATRHLRARSGLKLNWPRKAAHGAFMANQPVAFNFHAEEQRVVVAIGGDGDDLQAVATWLAFHPKLLPCAAPKSNKAGFERFRVTGGVQKSQHQHLARLRVLHDSWYQAVHFFKINVFHVFFLVFGFAAIREPACVGRRRAWYFFF